MAAEPEAYAETASHSEPVIEPEMDELVEPENEAIYEPEVGAEFEPPYEPEPEFEPSYEPEPEFEPSYEPETGPEYTNSTADPDGFAHPEVSSTEELWTWIALYSICIILTLVLNSIIIIGLTKRKNGFRRNQLDVYLTSLIVSRMFIATFVIPAQITGLFSEAYLGSIFCKLCHYIGIASATTSIFSTTAIAVLKYHDIVASKIRENIFKKKPLVGLVIIWLVGYLYAMRTPFLYDMVYVEYGNVLTQAGAWICTVDPQCVYIARQFVVVDLVCLFLVPGGVITFCYFKIVRKLKAESEAKQASSELTYANTQKVNPFSTKLPPVEVDLKAHMPLPTQSPSQQKIVMSIVVWVAVLFFVCSSLPYCFKLLLFCSGSNVAHLQTMETAFYFISYSNAWMNAVVLLRFRVDIRRAAMRFICKDGRVHVSEKQAAEEENTFGLG